MRVVTWTGLPEKATCVALVVNKFRNVLKLNYCLGTATSVSGQIQRQNLNVTDFFD